MKVVKCLEGFRRLLSGDKAVKVIVAVGLAGMALILISQLAGMGGEKADSKTSPDPATARFTVEEYEAQLEDKLQQLIVSIQGVGQAQVMVTLEHGVEYVYAQEEKSSLDKTSEAPKTDGGAGKEVLRQDTQLSYVLVDTEYGRKQALVTTQLQPKVQGVVIVCEGAGNPMVEQDLIHVVTTALHIPTTRVCVVKIDLHN